MNRLPRVRNAPTSVVVVVVLALIATVAGTAVAGPGATSSISQTKTKRIAKKQANKQIKKKAPNLKVARADTVVDGAVTATKLGTIVSRTASTVIAGNTVDPVGGATTASCAASERAIGGGARWLGGSSLDVQIKASRPATGNGDAPVNGATFTRWRATGLNRDTAPQTLEAYVVCLQ